MDDVELVRRERRRRFVGWGIVAVIAIASIWAGVRLMEWTYEVTAPVRFYGDVQHGLYWGFAANGPEGFLNQYEKMSVQEPGWTNWLDYAPLRLFVISRWTAWLSAHYPDSIRHLLAEHGGGRPTYPMIAPLLSFNLAMIGVGAASAFLLTRLWVRRATAAPRHFTGVWQGMAAALMFWFSPAAFISAFGWPTWDIWVALIYLLAALLASTEWWFAAGIVVGLGAMLKGQQLSVAAIFVIWPLVSGRVGPALRWAGGWCWLLRSWDRRGCLAMPRRICSQRRGISKMKSADGRCSIIRTISSRCRESSNGRRSVGWPVCCWRRRGCRCSRHGGIACGSKARERNPASWARDGRGCRSRRRGSRWRRRGRSAVCTIRRDSPCSRSLSGSSPRPRGPWWARGWSRAYVSASATAIAALLCMVIFHGSNVWWKCGIGYGMEHWPRLATGPIDNLPALFQDRFGWNDPGDWNQDLSAPVFTIPHTQVFVSQKMLFNSTFVVLLIASGIGIGLQARRRDRRMLVALVTPWLVFFCFPVQIQERYLLFGAAVSAICIGESVGMAMLGFFITLVAAAMTLNCMMHANEKSLQRFGELLNFSVPWLFSPTIGETLYHYLDNTHPDLAWGMLIATGVFLYVSLTKQRRLLNSQFP